MRGRISPKVMAMMIRNAVARLVAMLVNRAAGAVDPIETNSTRPVAALDRHAESAPELLGGGNRRFCGLPLTNREWLQARMPPRVSAARRTMSPVSNESIALSSPIARASRTSRASAPFSATGRPEKPARAGRKFVLNCHRRTNRTRFRDISLEFYEIGMSNNAVGNIDSEVVTGIACALLRHEDEIPRAVISGTRVCHRCRGDKAGGCNHPE